MEKLNFFKRLTIVSLFAVYTLILIGASVRASGSGMGCPDWPTCFGRIIPPISESQLPPDYQKIYAPKLAGKNQTLEKFNVQKTWTEYLNRLFGVFVGFLSLCIFLFSLYFRKTHKKLMCLSLSIFILVCLQGGLGAIVVATNLLPGMISAHMIIALIIMSLYIYLIFSIRLSSNAEQNFRLPTNTPLKEYKKTYYLIAFVLSILLLQILMGSQVREMIDFAGKVTNERSQWVNLLSELFYVHRSFSWVIIIANIFLLFTIYKHFKNTFLFSHQMIVCLLITLQIISGSLLNHYEFPIIVQPAHLLLATIILGIQFNFFIQLKHHRKSLTLINAL
jgi:cytochrome c oxidase assembly protein subunit 15